MQGGIQEWSRKRSKKKKVSISIRSKNLPEEQLPVLCGHPLPPIDTRENSNTHYQFQCHKDNNKAVLSKSLSSSTYALERGILSTLSGKYFGFTLCFIPTSFMGSGRPGFTVYSLAEDLCLGRCRSCMVQATLPNGPLIRAVTVGWGSGRVQTVILVSDHYLLNL